MHVPTHLEEAIEAALGARLQNVVTETWDDAAEAIAYLKRQRSGWATFLPLDTVRSRAALRLAPEAGVVGVGAELVQYEPRLRPVFEMLLGSVVVVEDLPTARRLLGRRLRASLFVTVEGETVQPSGALSGGTRQRSSNLVAQEREWQALPERIATLDGDLAGARQEAEAQRDALAALQHRTRELETKGRTLRADAEAAEQAVGVQAAEVREAERDIAWRANRLAQASKELEGVVAQEARLREELAEADRDHEGVVARVRELRDRLQAEDDRALRQRVAELETRAAVAERTVQSQRTLLGSHTRNLEQLRQQLQDKQAQGARLERDLAALADRRAAARERQEALAQRQAGLQARLEPARAALAESTARRQEIEEERARYVERLHEAELAQNRAVLDRDRARDDLLGLGEDIEENLGPIELPDEATRQLRLSLSEQVLELPKVDSLPTGLGEQIRQLRVRLRRLGNVNPDAPQEYEALRDRQTFLETQEADLRQAIAALREVIDELDTVIDRDFADTVRRVDDAFGDYFGRLFGGGSAKLVLTDPEDLSKTGVDILARPPGKRQQNLSLLSGGERALTAAALLFALLKANPVPFCCLDEVDAALDEANVQRFRALLTDHARSTQFVVITHNRRTIEAATTIYGISMSERGVSQSISLRLPTDGERPGGPLVAIEEPGNGHAPEPEEAEG